MSGHKIATFFHHGYNVNLLDLLYRILNRLHHGYMELCIDNRWNKMQSLRVRRKKKPLPLNEEKHFQQLRRIRCDLNWNKHFNSL